MAINFSQIKIEEISFYRFVSTDLSPDVYFKFNLAAQKIELEIKATGKTDPIDDLAFVFTFKNYTDEILPIFGFNDLEVLHTTDYSDGTPQAKILVTTAIGHAAISQLKAEQSKLMADRLPPPPIL